MTNKTGLVPLILTITVVVALLIAPSFAESDTALLEPNRPLPAPILNQALVPICTCESGQGSGKPQQYDLVTGGVLHGKQNYNDIGMCQINTQPENGHLVASLKKGWDIYTEDGNIRYANWLYAHEGSTPWNWSKGCWGDAIHSLSTTTH